MVEGDVSKVFENIMSTAEKHLCRTFDCVEPDGAPCAAYMGRGFVSVRKSRRVMPLCAGEDGHSDPYMIAISLVHLRFCELAALAQKNCQKIWNKSKYFRLKMFHGKISMLTKLTKKNLKMIAFKKILNHE